MSSKLVSDDNEIMIVTQNGIMIRLPVESISQIGRNTQGVRVINVDDEDRVIDMTSVVAEDEEVIEDAKAAENGEVDSDGSPDAAPSDAAEGPDNGQVDSDEEGA